MASSSTGFALKSVIFASTTGSMKRSSYFSARTPRAMPSIETTMATHSPHTLRQSRAKTTSLKAEEPHRSPFWRKNPKSAPIGIAVRNQ